MEQHIGSKKDKEYVKAVYCPCLFNLYAEYVMRNAGLEEAQAGIKIARRICRCHHPYGRNQRTKETLDESERGE